MRRALTITAPDSAPSPRALIGIDKNYENPVMAPDGSTLALILILPLVLLDLPPALRRRAQGKCLYVFSVHNDDYFLDSISWHGTDAELQDLVAGWTRVVIADEGAYSFSGDSYEIRCASEGTDDRMSYLGSGDGPTMLQMEDYSAIDDMHFIGQLDGADLPAEIADLFYLTDAVGYLYMSYASPALSEEPSQQGNTSTQGLDGLFFVQVT
ncbi:MAG: hypothetical protein Q4A92_01990 [Corynebacterium sp.]|nr:hypothetical protein [Corynebacterium sp.]